MYSRVISALFGMYAFPTWPLEMTYNSDCVMTNDGFCMSFSDFVNVSSILTTEELVVWAV